MLRPESFISGPIEVSNTALFQVLRRAVLVSVEVMLGQQIIRRRQNENSRIASPNADPASWFAVFEPTLFTDQKLNAFRIPIHQLHGVDRKSTRLNSSHSQISYAVFCLKKKKYTRNS